MSKIWIFGDSFSQDRDWGRQHILEQQWPRMLSKELDMKHKNFGIGGSGLDYSYHKWYQVRRKIKNNDIVIITASDLKRRWLINDKPQCSNPANLMAGYHAKWVSDKIQKVMRDYYFYLDHNDGRDAALYNWLCALDRMGENGTRILLMATFFDTSDLFEIWKKEFKHIDLALGNLVTVHNKEHVYRLRNKNGHAMVKFEGRCNHMCPINHHVLLNKILNWYKNHIPVDLTEGFHEDLIQDNPIDDPDMFATEHSVE